MGFQIILLGMLMLGGGGGVGEVGHHGGEGYVGYLVRLLLRSGGAEEC